MSDRQPRREALLAAALAGELDERDLDRACAADPSLRTELQELRELTARLDGADLAWDEEELPPGLADRILGATAGGQDDAPRRADAASPRGQHGRPGGRSPGAQSRRRRTGLALAGAGLVVAGVLGGQTVTGALQAPPTGPPGTLGAVEELTFSTQPLGTTVDAAFVAHTWGTETVLELDGLAVGETFDVVLVGDDGEQYASGTFLGAEQTVVCRMNAAVLRQDVSLLQIRDGDGTVVAESDVVDL